VGSLKSGNFPNGLNYGYTRFFPGLPFVILLTSYITGNIAAAGLILPFLSLVLIYFISYYFTKDSFYSFWITIFPPIVYEQTAKISTEALLIALFLLIYLLFVKKKYLSASLLAGFATVVRPVALFIYLPIFFQIIKKKEAEKLIKSIILFAIFPILFVIFNITYFGDVFYQIRANAQVGEASFSFLQMFFDVWLNIIKGGWRIIISGLAYIAFSFFLLYIIFKNKSDFLSKRDGLFIKLWTIGIFIFIFSVGPLQFLSEARRFLAVFFPLSLLVNYKFFSKKSILLAGVVLTLMAFI
jgi:hypothetical protein